MRLRNPPWVDAALKKNWAKLEKLVGPQWMPIDTLQHRTAPSAQEGREFWEYGTGAYGTVLPTHDPNVVVKITSDPSEAEIIAFTVDAAKREHTSMPEGLVHYHRIVQLPGAYKNRSIFAIWREAAIMTGSRSISNLGLDRQTEIEGKQYLLRFYNATDYLYSHYHTRKLDDQEVERLTTAEVDDAAAEYATTDVQLERRYKGRPRYATEVAFQSLSILAELLANTDGVYHVGRTYEYYLDHGVILADVHFGNLGLVQRKRDGNDVILVITDPGHAIFFKPQAYERPQMVANKRRRRRKATR